MKDLLVDPWMQSVNERHAKFRSFLVVVDALDEIEDRGGSDFLEELLRMVDKSISFAGPQVFYHQPTRPGTREFFTSDAICALYDIPTDTAKVDISTYLQAKLPKLWGNPEINNLMLRADGLFVFAATAVRSITNRSSSWAGWGSMHTDRLLCWRTPFRRSGHSRSSPSGCR